MADPYTIDDTGESLPTAVQETHFEHLKLLARGKVRDVYDLDDRILMIATDRISAYDSVLTPPIPDKGRVLTQLSLFWFDLLKDIIPHHFLSEDLTGMGLSEGARRVLAGRAMVVKKAKPLPVECIVRGYLVGSGWKEYAKSGTVCGMPLRAGYEQASKLDEPIFTPSTKAESGHDENISIAEMEKLVGPDITNTVITAAINLYKAAAEHALKSGIIIADTKFEFGIEPDGTVILIDEVLTPDSSRFWPADGYATGGNPPSFDKQFVRDWLDTVAKWDHTPPAPALPEDVVEKTREKYIEAYTRIAGNPLPEPKIP